MTFFARAYITGIGDPKPEKTKPKEKKPLKKVSEKRKAENKIYSTLRKVYLENHPLCEVKFKGCTKKSTEIHHDEGRGIRLNDVASFVAICRNCHNIVEKENLKVKK